MSTKIHQKLEKIAEFQSELFAIRSQIKSIRIMMVDHHNLNIQNTKLSLSFSQEAEQTGDKSDFNKSYDDIRKHIFIPMGFFERMLNDEQSLKNNKTYELKIDINPILLAQIVDTIIQNLLEREKVILFELRKLLK